VFFGEYRHTVDDKGRIAVPVKFRVSLDGGAFVTRWIDGCGAVYPLADWEALMAKVKSLPLSDTKARSFQRWLSAGSYPLDLDRQGRFVVPALVRDWAALAGEVVVVGAQDHVELWEPDRWAAFSAAMSSPEVLAEYLQGLGI
jgi:MraZ protein